MRGYFEPPSYKSPRDSLVARYAHRILLIILGFGILQTVTAAFVTDVREVTAVFMTAAASLIVAMTGLELLRRGHLDTTAYLIVIATGVGVVLANLSLGGVDTPAFAAYAIPILVGLILLQRQEAVITTVLTFAAMTVTFLIDQAGRLTPPPTMLSERFVITFMLMLFITGVMYSVTEALRKSLESMVSKHETIARTERLFRALTEKGFGSIMLVDADGIIRYAAPTAKRVLGYDADELMGKHVATPVHPEDLTRVMSVTQEVLENPTRDYTGVFRAQHQDGRWRWIEVIFTNLLADADVGAVVLNYRDISERIEADERRIASEVLYRTIINTTYEGVWMLDNSGRTTFVNSRMAEMIGWSVPEMIDLPFMDFVAEARRQDGSLPWSARSDGVAVSDVVLKHRDGRRIWVIANTNLLYDTEGMVTGTVAMLTDITERKQAEVALQRANRAFRTLSACNQELVRAIDQQELITSMVTTLVNEATIYVGAWIEVNYTGDETPVLWKAAYGKTSIRGSLPKDTAAPAEVTQVHITIPDGTSHLLLRLPIIAEHLEGALYVLASAAVEDPDAAEIGLLRELAEDIGYGLASLNTRRDLERVLLSLEARNQDVTILHEASRFIRESIDVKDICEKFYVVLDRAIGCDTLIASRFDSATREIAPLCVIHRGQPVEISSSSAMILPESTGDVRLQTLQSGEARSFTSSDVLPLVSRSQESFTVESSAYGLFDPEVTPTAAILMPLPLNDTVLGLVEVYGRHDAPYSDDHLRLVESLAAHVAVTINKAMLYQQAQNEIAERERAEDALRRSEDKFRTLFNHAPDGALIIDPATDLVLEANAASETLLGYPTQQLVGTSFTKLLNSDSAQAADALMLHSAQMLAFSTLPIRRSDGAHAIVDLTLTTIPWMQDHVTLATLRDASDRLDLEAERIRTEVLQAEMNKERELVNLKSRFVSTVSHEFRTPLSVILSSSDILTRYGEKMTHERHQEHIDRIRGHAMLMTEMLNDVLTLNKMQSGAGQLQPGPVDVIRLCESVLEQVRISRGEHHVLQFSYQGDFADIVIDDKVIQHVLLNLLTNAVKYSPSGSSVDLRLRREGETLLFEIQDRGIGIPEEDQARMFEPFYRAVNAADIEGTGLGLAIVKEKVLLHGGEISFVSRVGEGTTFRVRIPCHQLNDAN